MKKYAVVWKHVGETPLEVLEAYRKEQGIGESIPMAYAGRLDPMAEGKLLILIGEECKKLKSYMGLDKEYEFEVLFGFSSDTGDVLGLAAENAHAPVPDERLLRDVARKFTGRQSFPYPRFSSKTVQGKPLHMWTLEGRLNEIDIPVKESTIYSLRYAGSRLMSKEELKKEISTKIDSIAPVTDPRKALGRDFRRDEIRARWDELLKDTAYEEFLIARYRCIASSGTYMRTLAEKIGESLGSSGLAFSIKRTVIGKYLHLPLFGWWIRRF